MEACYHELNNNEEQPPEILSLSIKKLQWSDSYTADVTSTRSLLENGGKHMDQLDPKKP